MVVSLLAPLASPCVAARPWLVSEAPQLLTFSCSSAWLAGVVSDSPCCLHCLIALAALTQPVLGFQFTAGNTR